MQKRTLLTVLITFLATSLLWIGLLVGLYWHFYGDEPPFHVAINHPAQVALGSEFELVLAVEPSGREHTTLGSVDFYDSLMNGFKFVASNPPHTSTEKLLNFTTLWYQEELPSDGPLKLRIRLRAARVGRHGGQVDICTPTEVCTTIYTTLTVTEAG